MDANVLNVAVNSYNISIYTISPEILLILYYVNADNVAAAAAAAHIIRIFDEKHIKLLIIDV